MFLKSEYNFSSCFTSIRFVPQITVYFIVFLAFQGNFNFLLAGHDGPLTQVIIVEFWTNVGICNNNEAKGWKICQTSRPLSKYRF